MRKETPRERQIRRRRKSLVALAGASRDVVLATVTTAGCAVAGLVLFTAGSVLKGTRRRIGTRMKSKEALFYEGMILGGILVAVAPSVWVTDRAADARFITHKFLGLRPPTIKRHVRHGSGPKPPR